MMLETLQLQIIASQYFQMNYTVTDSFVLQISLTNKLQCFALCARQWTQCNIATFNSISKPSCLLSNEQFITHNLVPMNNSIVVDFRRSNTKDTFLTTIESDTSIATEATTNRPFITTNYGSLIDNGVDDLRNDYVIFNHYQSITLPGYVSNVSIKFCTLPTTTQPVLWIYIIHYTGVSPYFTPYDMYQIPYNQINTISPIQEFNIPHYRLNVTIGQYLGIGFGKITGGSPCQVIPGNSSYTNAYGGANQTYLSTTQSSYSYSFQTRAVALSFTVQTR